MPNNVTPQHVAEVKKLLESKNLADLNYYLKMNCGFSEGMDAYCNQCDCVYCYEHYRTEVVFDEEFYDYTIGTCPQMHRRKIDD